MLTAGVGRAVDRDTFFCAALLVAVGLELALVELLVELLVVGLAGLLGVAVLGVAVLLALVLAGTNAAVSPVPVLPHAASTVEPATAAAANDARRGSRVDGVGRKVTESPGLSCPGHRMVWFRTRGDVARTRWPASYIGYG